VILHKPDTGPSTILTTKYLNRDADNNDLFSAVSTNGLSKFALAAVSPTTSGSSMTTTDDDDSSTTPVTSDSTNTNAKSTSEKKKGGVYDYALTDMSYGTASYQVTTVSQKGRMAITPLKAKIESMPDAKASWSVEIVNDPDGGGKISSGIISSIPENVLNSYHRILDEQGLDISSVAYSMSVIKDDRIGATREGIVWMTAPQQWVSDNGGETRIKILRISDEGKGEILKTSFSNYDMESGYLTFKGDSPDGLCSFTLIAVKPLTGRVATSMESDTGQINSSSTKWRDADRFLLPNGNGILSNALLGGILIVIGCSGLGMIYWIWKREGE
jgi:hypothetical protein